MAGMAALSEVGNFVIESVWRDQAGRVEIRWAGELSGAGCQAWLGHDYIRGAEGVHGETRDRSPAQPIELWPLLDNPTPGAAYGPWSAGERVPGLAARQPSMLCDPKASETSVALDGRSENRIIGARGASTPDIVYDKAPRQRRRDSAHQPSIVIGKCGAQKPAESIRCGHCPFVPRLCPVLGSIAGEQVSLQLGASKGWCGGACSRGVRLFGLAVQEQARRTPERNSTACLADSKHATGGRQRDGFRGDDVRPCSSNDLPAYLSRARETGRAPRLDGSV
ncbi:hypothetical protein GGTG_12754 [Gaeumannomyces tritici R3-111a-1]|uniref:Uncharacterized protein n=1 Tax=Gaeumannomyces tritici (strain R3-111a-1) TaxID=644352 RepID=J3PGX4_GAET3|nr:hypothetical protein GGTG_12754 [Gaeumannomyces tritici R3-111a-1]EJT69871.1 hypothetical protein GGTG_12754 [Gaeumannomyces tritici R3-111a-1]